MKGLLINGKNVILLLFCVSFQIFIIRSHSIQVAESNGFGDNIKWVDYQSALDDQSKPTVVILHKSWCPACQKLKPQLSHNFDFEKLSAKFSMVNAKEEDPLHALSEFNIDGTYIPRLFFMSPSGQVIPEIQNLKGNPKYKYYHYNSETVIDCMKKVSQIHPIRDKQEL